jgi:hypothetical protein
MIALPYMKSQDKYDGLTQGGSSKCLSWFQCCCQSESRSKISTIYANEKKDKSQLSILTKSLASTCDVLSQSPTPVEETSEIFSATPWLTDVSHLNDDISQQICLTVLVTFYEVAKLECETVRSPGMIVVESMTEIQSILSGMTTIKLTEFPQKLEKLIEDISKLPLKANSDGKIIINPIDVYETNDSNHLVSSLGTKKLKEIIKILSIKTQLKKLNKIKIESERDRKLLEDGDKKSSLISESSPETSSSCLEVDPLNLLVQRNLDGDEVNERSQMLHADLQKELKMVNSDITDEKKADLVQLYLKYLRSELDLKESQ